MFAKKWVLGLLAMVCATAVWAAEPEVTVSDVRVQSHWPWDHKVDIHYTIGIESAGTNTVTVSFSGTNRATGRVHALQSVTGPGADEPVGPGSYSVVWDAGADLPEFSSDAFVIKVSAYTGGLYLVIDLSGGPDAASYPVTMQSALPDPIPDECRTTKLALRRIMPGTFVMGSPEDELGRSNYETQHSVTLTKPFYMGVFEVTQKQWELVTGNNPSSYPGELRPVEMVSYNDIRGTGDGAGWPEHNRVDATSFFGKLRAKTGLEMDLPTEAQWEYACRAGTTRAYNDYTKNNGEGSDCLTSSYDADANMEPLAWYYANSYNEKHHTVGTKQPNAWGLCDMHGNIREWCLDWYPSSQGSDDETDPVGAANGSSRVTRGGGWFRFAKSSRSANRYRYSSVHQLDCFGFRACSSPPVQ